MIYRFAKFSLNTDILELTAGSSSITAEPQALLLLQYLIENRDRVVSRDDIFKAVWNGRIVSDSALTYAIKEARRIIGDDGKTQSMIRTLPRRGFRFVAEVTEESAPTRGVPSANRVVPSDNKPSIAVLAFENMSGDPEQDYFSDGMAEDLITDISKISGLFVSARNSSFALKGKAVDVQEIAERLGVKFILEGSVRKMASRLRVNAQLIDTGTGGHVWAERYDGDIEKIFDFQDDIREQIVSALKVSLTAGDRALIERRSTDSVEAHDLFLKGRSIFYSYTPEHFEEAIRSLERAIEIDPNFAEAYSYLSYLHFSLYLQISPGSEDRLALANQLAERGVALDDLSAHALARLGYIQIWRRAYDQAIANSQRALTLAPDNAEVHASFGQVLNYWGNPAKGLEMLEKALNLDLFVSPVWEMQAGLSHWLLRQHDRAESRLCSTIVRSPKYLHAYTYLACTYTELGRTEEAHKCIEEALKIAPAFTVAKADQIFPYRLDDERNRLLNNLRKAGLPEK